MYLQLLLENSKYETGHHSKKVPLLVHPLRLWYNSMITIVVNVIAFTACSYLARLYLLFIYHHMMNFTSFFLLLATFFFFFSIIITFYSFIVKKNEVCQWADPNTSPASKYIIALQEYTRLRILKDGSTATE